MINRRNKSQFRPCIENRIKYFISHRFRSTFNKTWNLETRYSQLVLQSIVDFWRTSFSTCKFDSFLSIIYGKPKKSPFFFFDKFLRIYFNYFYVCINFKNHQNILDVTVSTVNEKVNCRKSIVTQFFSSVRTSVRSMSYILNVRRAINKHSALSFQ